MKLPLATGFLSKVPAAIGGNRDSGRFRVREDRVLDSGVDLDAAPPAPRSVEEPLAVADLSPPPAPISQLSL